MGSRNFQFEILVVPEHLRENIVSNNDQNKFKCSQENLLAYWIPEGFRAVLMPKKDLHLVRQPNQLSNNISGSPSFNHQANNNAPTNQQNSHVIRNASVKRRNNPMGNGRQMRRPLTALDMYYLNLRAKSSTNLPPETVFEMWHAEPEDVRRKYRRLALRQRIELGLRYNNTCRPPLKSQLMMNSSGFSENMQNPLYENNNTTASNMLSNVMKENMQQQNMTRFYSYVERSVPIRQDSSGSSESDEDSDDAPFARLRNNHHVPSSYGNNNENNPNDLH
ncbi:14283_t:CDS:2 [Ambispora leptoticha]|uniref:14283_t:CDS:1 n=1 Tax=Ambispora leptoticha TaxID=144679 RepID=A0A9N9BZ16_9GLOM|nr:14283_t:CDS:2 [Ambispora leptoticha]